MSPETKVPNAPMASPEQLDEAVRTTTVRGWLALALAALAIATVLVWSLVATIPRQVTATAVVTDRDASRAVVAGETGAVTVTVEPGERVERGDEIARVIPFGGGSPDAESVAAPLDGRLRDILVVDGQGVEPTDTILTLNPAVPPKRPRLTAFLPRSEAVLYRPGAEVSVTLADLASGETSYVPARVRYVAETPSPIRAIEAALQSEDLAGGFDEEAGGAAYRVEMAIVGSEGEAVEGQVAEVTNTYDRQHPIELLFDDAG